MHNRSYLRFHLIPNDKNHHLGDLGKIKEI